MRHTSNIAGHPKRIARRFVIYIILISSVITLAMTAIHLTLDYQRDLTSIENSINLIRTSHLQSLVNSVWVEDEQQIRSQLDGLARYSDMEYLSISLNNEVAWSSGNIQSKLILEQHIPLIQLYRGKNINIGELHVVASIDAVVTRLIDKAVVILFSNALQIFFVAGFIFLLFHYLVARHLQTLSKWARSYCLTDGFIPIMLDRPSHKNGDISDEFDAVVGAMNDMQKSITNSYEKLQDIANGSQQRLRLHLQNTPLAAITWDAQFRCTDWNKSAENIFGYSREEALGSYGAELLVSEDMRDEINAYFDALKNLMGESHNVNKNITKQGKSILCEWFNTPLIGGDGKCIGIASLAQDITAQHDAEKKIIAAKEEAELANAAKSQFLSRMSHELRTPLNAILGFGQLLEEDDGSLNLETRKQYTKTMMNSGWHLLNLVEDVLDLASIEANKLELSMDTINTVAIIHECVNTMLPLAQDRNITLENTEYLNCDGCSVKADALRLKQVLLNLISNAVKYNREGGSVSVTCEKMDTSCGRICVTDTGTGISKENQDALFEPFSRLYLDTYALKGTGIGLSITKHLTELMGGSIGMDSQPGKGSTFWIELELDQQTGSECEAKVSVAKDESATEQCYTLLYVEDSPSHIQLLQAIVDTIPNISFLTAHTPLLGLELAAAHNPDLIILDICLPGMDGYKVLSKLQEHETLRDTPVIAMSSNAMPHEVEKGLRAGFRRYLTKPIKVTEFKKAINELLVDSAI